MAIPVYVLIGGTSRRFGVDKASHPVSGEPWALHVGRRLGSEAPTLIGREAPGGDLAGLRFVADAEGIAGPLAGVLAALRDRVTRSGPGLLTLASCDLVRPEAAWLKPLADAHAASDRLETAAYRAADRWQPFPSVAHTRWLTRLEAAVTAGADALQEALSQSETHAEPWAGPESGPPQANTPEELAKLLG